MQYNLNVLFNKYYNALAYAKLSNNFKYGQSYLIDSKWTLINWDWNNGGNVTLKTYVNDRLVQTIYTRYNSSQKIFYSDASTVVNKSFSYILMKIL